MDLLVGFVALPAEFWPGVIGSLVFGLIGLVILLGGLVAGEVLTRKLNIQEALGAGNVAVAIVVGSFLLALAYIAAHVVH